MGISKRNRSTVAIRTRQITPGVEQPSPRVLPNKGFTLVELLVAASITFLIISASLVGLIEVLRLNQQSESETLRRQDLNRSLDFMADEIRRATWVYPDAQKGVQDAAPDFSLPNSAVPVLAITIPGLSKPIVYYQIQASSPWLGPNLIRRWGPTFDTDGNYLKPSQPSEWDADASDGVGDVLVDAIETQSPDPNPTCAANWLANPPINNRQGFFNCVSQDGRSVFLQLAARLKGGSGGAATVYNVNSDISVRSR
jgi:type II secretory pathway pseudopilin PulG